jgi:site-specific DNA-methyltransferase (adenine-specific)
MNKCLVGDCRDVLPTLEADSIDAIVTDPPYHLTAGSRGGHAPTNNPESPHGRHRIGDKGFMGKLWDGGDIAFRPETWEACLHVLKPGAHMLAFGGTRTYHRMVCAIEDAGFEIRDCIMWVYGTGFPKSLNVGDGRGTALKPAVEPIVVARRPLVGTTAENVAQFGCGAINVDACRVPIDDAAYAKNCSADRGHDDNRTRVADFSMTAGHASQIGRWPANLAHDGSQQVLDLFPSKAGAIAPVYRRAADKFRNTYGAFVGDVDEHGSTFRGDTGSAARFFYCAKATKTDRGDGNDHPTVKPTALMRWLCRLVTPPGGTVLDPFMGSGSTGIACAAEGFDFIGVEREESYAGIARSRISHQFAEQSAEAVA